MKVIKSDLIIDGKGGIIKKGIILIQKDKISQIGTENEINIPKDSEIIDLNNQIILPGLIDPHRHLPGSMDERPFYEKIEDPPAYKALWSARVLREDLKRGTTTIRLCGQGGDDWWYFDLRRALDEDVIAGPRILTAGKALRSAHGHGYFGNPVTGIENIQRTIRENFVKGADCVKIFLTGGGSSAEIPVDASFYTKEEIIAAVNEAQRVGTKIVAHCYGGIGATWFIEAGGHSIEHGNALTDEQMDLMIKNDTYYTLTLWGLDWESVKAYYPKERTRDYLGIDKTRDWVSNDKRVQSAKELRNRRGEQKSLTIEHIKKAIKKGVKFTTHGDVQFGTLPWNIITLVKRIGLSPMEAILANTKSAAECCGILDRVGTLEPGKFADMISLKGNPLTDIMNIQKIGMVMMGGRLYDPITGYWTSYDPIEKLRCFSFY